MRIISKAKPIRIRIKSGEEEHSSLDSLRRNLCVQELWPLIKDHRLSRWLRQLGEVDLAHDIDALSESQLDFSTYFKVLLLFLKDDLVGCHVTELYTLFSFWHDCEKRKSKNYDSLRKYLLSTYEGAKFIFKQYPKEVSDGEWWDVFCTFENVVDPDFSFEQGKLAFEGFTKSDGMEFRDIVRADELIKVAADLGNNEAIAFENQLLLARRKTMLTPEAKNKIQRQIARWKTDKLGYLNKMVDSDEDIVKETKFLLREFTSLLRIEGRLHKELTIKDAKSKYKQLDKTNPFYVENRFALEFILYKYLAYDDEPSANLFVELANKYNYPLAKYMLNPPTNRLIKGFDFINAYFFAQLEFILDHLFDY